MTTLPSVSVVIPTFQRREWTVRAVRSVLAQRGAGAVETIVVDDGSTDGTAEALDGFGDRVRVLRLAENVGATVARNRALEIAQGELVAFLDSDDVWEPDHLWAVSSVLGANPQVSLVTTSPWFRIRGRERPERATLFDALPLMLLDSPLGWTSAMAMRRADVDAVGRFDERFEIFEDIDLWRRVVARGPCAALQRRTMRHQYTAGSLMERGRRTGGYLSGPALAAQKALAEMRAVERPDRPWLIRRAEGRIAFVAAMYALAAGDDAEATEHLAEACRCLPDLSVQPYLVARRLWVVTDDGDARQRLLADAARCWPEPGSDTAIFLRLRALALAVRMADRRRSHAAASGLDLPSVASFARRERGILADVVHQRAQAARWRAREPVAA